MMKGFDIRYLALVIPLICGAILITVLLRTRWERIKNTELKRRYDMRAERNREIEKYREESRAIARRVMENIDRENLITAFIDECDKHTGKFFTESPAVDALLSYKKNLCSDRGIDTTFNIDFPINILPEKEAVSLLGNLMDNAIEAAAKCMEGKRYIKVESKKIKGQWVLKIENAKPESEKPLENNMETTKENPLNHGMGMKIIKKIIIKNKGYIRQYDNGTMFETFLSLPMKKEG